ncbi:hypothetical protein CDL12_19049 [Handroanthus impetiginosus]|uniref:Uncharacterized protein n=1 Tax=Handroanthus impetiginosus TaxID=429701 RepID=A0A2G9GT40_9LAMI|nr:hypothetical protein CDL12_19049 [Handroanthus impetiginosus]
MYRSHRPLSLSNATKTVRNNNIILALTQHSLLKVKIAVMFSLTSLWIFQDCLAPCGSKRGWLNVLFLLYKVYPITLLQSANNIGFSTMNNVSDGNCG